MHVAGRHTLPTAGIDTDDGELGPGVSEAKSEESRAAFVPAFCSWPKHTVGSAWCTTALKRVGRCRRGA
jgi:hypothetical protein